jgi:hypothetical protein
MSEGSTTASHDRFAPITADARTTIRLTLAVVIRDDAGACLREAAARAHGVVVIAPMTEGPTR